LIKLEINKALENFDPRLSEKWNSFCNILPTGVHCCFHFPLPSENQAMHVIWFILFGLVVGLIARALMPGKQPMGFILTALLGMAGSFVGGYLGSLIRGGGGDANLEATDPYNWIGAVLGALLLLFLYGLLAGRKTSV
jgi:uncharacterized membrane protein YeaQ/YmgE (transglycosylase-associated protein family)